MIEQMVADADTDLPAAWTPSVEEVATGSSLALARTITALEAGALADDTRDELRRAAARRSVPVLGITGTGGSGKSSLTDELVRRFRIDQEDKLRIAILAVDPTRRRSGGALLGDRIRMNAIDTPHVYFRSLATREAASEIPPCLPDAVAACAAWGADLVIVETPGIGQGDSAVTELADVSLFV
jgi:methylmalonyl-CoA mutase